MSVEPNVARMMRLLNCDEAEARQVIADDKAIDRGEPMPFDLTPEQMKISRQYTKIGTRKTPTVYNFEPRKRKENPTKQSIIAELAKFLTEQSENACENVNITNKERQIAFSIGTNNYELTLVQKRAPKS
jgi:hypothetical protein